MESKLNAAENIGFEQFQSRAQQVLETVGGLTLYLHGAADVWCGKDAAQQSGYSYFNELSSNLKGSVSDIGFIPEPKSRPRLLPRGSHAAIYLPVFNSEEVNSAFVCYYQVIMPLVLLFHESMLSVKCIIDMQIDISIILH